MTLPFPTDDGQRKYQCFVCGTLKDNYEDYKSHIIEKHEIARDYILCPLKHCCAPIRDLRAHFKAKHSYTAVPEVGMSRALVWRDIKSKIKRKKKPKFKEGYHFSTKMNKNMHYRSGYELTIYECLDMDNDVLSFGEEPFEIPYIHQGKQHKYTPDIIIKFIDQRVEVWEIKPSNQTLLKVNQNKWSSANLACKSRGWEFVVITEKGIHNLKRKVGHK